MPKETSARVARIASQVLRDRRSGEAAKSTAGSAMSQREQAATKKKEKKEKAK